MKFFIASLLIVLSASTKAYSSEKIEIAIFTEFYECSIIPEIPTGDLCGMWMDHAPNAIIELDKETLLDHSQLGRVITTKVFLTKKIIDNGDSIYLMTASSYENNSLIVPPQEYQFKSPQEVKRELYYGSTITTSKDQYLKPFLYVSGPWQSTEM